MERVEARRSRHAGLWLTGSGYRGVSLNQCVSDGIEIAARAHAEKLDFTVELALNRAHVALRDIAAIGVTAGPGLIGGVLSGVMLARGLAAGSGKPLFGINHLAGVSTNAPIPER